APRPDLELTTFHSWEEVGAWYADLQKDQIVVTPELQKKAEELTKGLNTEDEKIHALYNFVAIRFHYVSLSFGIGRYQPHAADEVLGNEYGDCKDKHTLLATMLKAVGIDAWPALINSARKIDNDLPSPSSFDHMITVIPRGNQMIWLDTTSEVAPFGLLLTGLRGKQALIIPRGKPAQLVKTPEEAVLPFANNFSVDGKLGADGVFTGHVDRSFRGDIEVLMRASYRRLPQSNWKDLTQQLSYATGFSGDVSEVQVSTPEDTAKPFTLSYDYTRKKYGDWDNHRITPPMPPFGIEVPDTDERRPVEPFLLGATGEVVYHARVELPAFSRAVAPSDMDLKEDFAEYQATYSIKDGVLTADRRLIVKKSEVSVADWDRYAKFRKAVSDDENKWINLDVRTVSTVAKNSSWPKFYTDDADHKFQQATQALQNHDIIKSTDLMREVLQLDPKYQGANAIMGWLDFVQNRREDGLAKLQKEEYLHPDYVPSYAMGAWMYTVLKRPDDASDQWRKLLKVQPENRDAVMKLSRLLIDSKKYTDAINILEETSATAPDNKVIKSLLATAYLRSGQREEGVNIIQKNFADETNPSLLNDVAYELALANTNLELAEKFSQSSVKFFDSLTVTKEVNNNTAGDMAAIFYTLQVTSAWDTLGWIYFRMGQLDKAVSYLRPAWMITQSSTQGDHLAQVYQQQGKIKEAEHTYQLAYAAASSLNGNAEEIREHYRALTGKPLVNSVSTHRLPDGSWSLTAAEELGRIRTFKVPVKSSANGSATFGVAFVNGKVEQVVFVDGSTELKSLSDDVRNANFDVLSPQDNFPVRVVRRGILMCRSTGCEFTFMLPPNESPNELPTAF
ncbi:MAG TPA: tetratricopeptide repeat protein, partial [Terriglobales bacterium]|nr:tetratricopeptide repeat protein [Terriglobales bacterium]